MRSERLWLGAGLVVLVLSVLFCGFSGRRGIRDALVTSCKSSIVQRVDTVSVRFTQAVTDQATADDEALSWRTRRAAAHQAYVERRSVRRLRPFLDPAHGGRRVCADVYPAPRLIPWP